MATIRKVIDEPGKPFDIIMEQYFAKFGDGGPNETDFVNFVTKQFIFAIVYTPTVDLFSYQQSPQEFITRAKKLLPSYIKVEDLLNWPIQKFLDEIVRVLSYAAINYPFLAQDITPWTIELIKQRSGFANFLKPVRTKLPIVVLVDEKQSYVHECTEELLYGILSVVSDNKRFTFYFKDVLDIPDFVPAEIYFGIVMDNYDEERVSTRRYTATIERKYKIHTTFYTLDVIQGVITGCQWLNIDPHNYITNINDNGQKVRF